MGYIKTFVIPIIIGALDMVKKSPLTRFRVAPVYERSKKLHYGIDICITVISRCDIFSIFLLLLIYFHSKFFALVLTEI